MDKYVEKALERFLRYVRIDTQSDENSEETPSAKKELDLLLLLQKELKELGIDGEIDQYGRLYAHIPGEEGHARIGLNSHVDTASELSGANVSPRIIEDYDGGRIVLSEEASMSPEEFPALRNREGDTLVVTDGRTLLGGDDKAGVALIMGTIERVLKENIPHHPLSILFTPDEEIGRGAEHFDREKFGADFAYTVDGDDPLAIDWENFNAASAKIHVEGVAIHPGEAKGKLVNALRLAYEVDSLLPKEMRPENTEGREGFFHPLALEGSAASCTLSYIIRNHDSHAFLDQKKMLEEAVRKVAERHPSAKLSLEIKDQYRNMAEVIEGDPRALIHAKRAFRSLGLEPRSNPIRGGTDGATFSFLGCPCPNLGTGSYNHHGRYEFLSLKDFGTMMDVLLAIVRA